MMNDIDALLEWKNEAERNGISEVALREESERILNQLEASIDELFKYTALRAMIAGDIFHKYKREALQDKELENPLFSTRVRIRGNSLQPVWYSNIYRLKGGGVTSKEIAKGRNRKYPMSKFKAAGDDEYLVIEYVESRYANIRDTAARIVRLRKALAEAKNCAKSMYEDE